jgi:hypothetical protein
MESEDSKRSSRIDMLTQQEMVLEMAQDMSIGWVGQVAVFGHESNARVGGIVCRTRETKYGRAIMGDEVAYP